MSSCYQDPDLQEIIELLVLYKDAEANGLQGEAEDYQKALRSCTHASLGLFVDRSPDVHPVLWDAMYAGETDYWTHDLPNPALVDVMKHYTSLLRGVDPPLQVLRPWVGHGFGHQGVRLARPPPVGVPGRKLRALVPGCGCGADALFLAKICGYEVVAVDTSPVALTMARKRASVIEASLMQYLKGKAIWDRDTAVWGEMALDAESRWGRGIINTGPITWLVADFLADECLQDDEKFDLIFDNNFFSALHPHSRPIWALKMTKLLARPHGRLVCRETPQDKDIRLNGPPFGAGLWFYQLHLAHPGNHKVVDYLQGVIDLSPEATATSGPGLTQVVRYLATDVDDAEEEEIKTWISIWSHALGGPRPNAQQITLSESRNMYVAPQGATGRPGYFLKRRKAQQDLRRPSSGDDGPTQVSLVDSALTKTTSSRAAHKKGLDGCEPEAERAKRVKFSIPSTPHEETCEPI